MFDLSYTGLEKGCLAGQVALVTGATSNVGRGYAQSLAWAGAKVAIVGRNAVRGEAAAAEINADEGEGTAAFFAADVSSPEDIARLKNEVLERFGRVDILINNAMDLSLNGPILGASVEELDRSYAISARAVLMTVNAFVPDMVERGMGTVIYSTTQFNYMPPMIGGSIYTAGKAAATSATMSLANELKGTGVDVFCLAPGGVGVINSESVDDPEAVANAIKMPGFPGLIPTDAAGAALVYCILRGKEIHGSGLITNNVLKRMKYPFPCPETLRPDLMESVDGMKLTMFFCYMGPGFPEG